jgi:Sec-independent protein translocase protein TatA
MNVLREKIDAVAHQLRGFKQALAPVKKEEAEGQPQAVRDQSAEKNPSEAETGSVTEAKPEAVAVEDQTAKQPPSN